MMIPKKITVKYSGYDEKKCIIIMNQISAQNVMQMRLFWI